VLSNEYPSALPQGSAIDNHPLDEPTPLKPEHKRRYRRIAGFLLLLLAALFLYLLVTAPLSKSLQPIAAPSITLLSAEGKPIARRGAVTGAPVDVTSLPEHVPAAFLAIEDRRFYDHSGVDPWGIMRAAVVNLQAGGVVEGGSTISQQLAKLAFLSSDRTYARKLQEFILAFWLEGWLTKDEILSRYLSSVYFGDNVYGLRAAANHYFSRKPEDLTIGQAAMLAGLVKAPSRLAPTGNLKGARERGRIVVRAMVDAGAISETQAAKIPTVKLKRGPVKDLPTGTYFADWVFPEARAYAQEGYGGDTIVTTLEDDLQRLAVDSVRRAGVGGAQVALVAMRPDGRVVAMIGGKNYKKSPFNRATQAKRQPGSAFKLFVYLAALRAGMTPASLVEDEPLRVGSWSPKNYENKYRGMITLREAFAVSSNVAAVRLSERVGRENVIEAARDLGITSELDNQPSLALGTSGVSLMEMVSAYATLAANNYPVRPRGLPEMEESWYDRMLSRRRSFDSDERQMMLEMLWAVTREGTGRGAALPIDSFGKTGTSQDSRDALFIGFAGDLVTGVWIGHDDNSPLGETTGGTLPAQIWRNFMARAVDTRGGARVALPAPTQEFEPVTQTLPDNVQVPIGDSGYDVGIAIGPDEVTISAEPNADSSDAPAPRAERTEPLPEEDEEPAPREIPTIAPPPPPPEDEGEEPPPEEE
jgi:penicillin-binding protein 1A